MPSNSLVTTVLCPFGFASLVLVALVYVTNSVDYKLAMVIESLLTLFYLSPQCLEFPLRSLFIDNNPPGLSHLYWSSVQIILCYQDSILGGYSSLKETKRPFRIWFHYTMKIQVPHCLRV
nr:hypothetical protein Iba_chr05dCG16380 [Ipomoea batatas]